MCEKKELTMKMHLFKGIGRELLRGWWKPKFRDDHLVQGKVVNDVEG